MARPLPLAPTTGKSTTLRLYSLRSPHMLNFHLAWFAFFSAFTSWFALNPLMKSTIAPDLGIDEHVAASADITNVASTIFFRMVMGVVTDKVGPRRAMAVILVCGAVPVGLTGLVSGGTGLVTVRFFMGVLGAAFVPCQYWTTTFFSKKIVGTANAVAGGWGNMGGGATFLIMPHVFAGLVSAGLSSSAAWRVALVVPVGICWFAAAMCFFLGTDKPERGLPVDA
ncbi:hypothetical protein HK104_005590, partial [Borealophlyctis nickersoniae]